MSHLKSTAKTIRPIRRTAALLCAALASVGLAGRVSAQVTGPLVAPYTSPPQPTPYQWPNFHSGGAPIPAAQYPVPPSVNAALGLTPLIDPLQGQLQGTPTELYNGAVTQIPSYVLGNYDPTRPPTAFSNLTELNIYFPNHFADGSIFSWAAPFNYIPQTSGQVTADDLGPAPVPPTTVAGVTTPGVSGFTASNGFTSVTAPGAATPGNDTSPAAEAATNAEYLRLAAGTNGSAIWTLEEPNAGNYSLYLHIPSDVPDSAGNTEPRDTQVVYEIRVLDANGNVTASTTASASQTEANDSQFLAGPFQVAANGSVVVTMTRSTTAPVINDNLSNPDYLVADSMTLQQTIGDVQSSPTAITSALYPADFARAQYWGIYVPATVSANALSTSTNPATAALQNAEPDTTDGTTNTNILLKTGSTTTALGPTAGLYDPTRLIRQLVYFGRSDPSASVTATVDDSSAGFSGNGTAITDTTGTASNGEYRVSGTAAGQNPTTEVARWTVPVPATGAGSPFFVTVHIPATPAGQARLSRVFYQVTVNTGTLAVPVTTVYTEIISQVTQGADALVTLPTGALLPAVGSSIIVQMYNENGLTTSSPTGTVVVADSVNVTTGTGQGAIYCVDGFTGGVLWRFETPGSANGASAPVFASPAITRINVYTPALTVAGVTTPAGCQNKLVVIVGDNNGLVYCLDAIGNGDGTSNAAVLNPTTLQPITIPQPAYGTVVAPIAAGTPYAAAAAAAHVGTTSVYWIYRPDANQPKYVTGTDLGQVKPIDPTEDLPVPAAFSTASPNVFVDPTVSTGVVTTANPTPAPATASNSIVYIGNSNGVLYALDGGGAPIDGTSAATFAASGDTFNVSQNVQGAFPQLAIPSAQPKWWFSLRGVDPNSGNNASSADIESAPSLYVKLGAVTPIPPSTATTAYLPTVYIGSAHEMESTSNVGRLYALNGLYGPAGDNGQISPITQPDPTKPNYTGPGSFSYNVGQRPRLNLADTSDWTFPDAYGDYTVGGMTFPGQSYNSAAGGKTGGARPALGNITGSPVVFTNIDETKNNPTRIYIAANSGYESTTAQPVPTARPDDTLSGRVWAVNLDGSVGTTTNSATTAKTANNSIWAYPLAFDPNDAAKDNTPEPDSPIGSFLRATPAIGFVQFPRIINLNQGSTNYDPTDAVNTAGIDGASVPMLYLGTRGVNDTSLYALDIDGTMTPDNEGTSTTATDTRTIYQVVSPDGSIFQSSVALVANATTMGGNGGSIYAVAGNTLYDYGATPISNPFTQADTGILENFPLIRENKAFTGFGPISSPSIAGASVTDLVNIANPTGNGTTPPAFTTYPTDTTDWVMVGDSSSGLCRGITPQDATYGGIPLALGRIVPPNPTAPGTELLNALIQTFLVPTLTNVTSTQALPVGAGASLPVYDWGENVYACFTNVAPPNPTVDPTKFVYDSVTHPDLTQASAANPIPFYTSDGTTNQTVTFNLSDADTTSTNPILLDNGSVSTTNGYIVDTGTLTADTNTPRYSTAVANVVQNLKTASNTRYLGTYTYTIADGSARNNTPGARRRFLNVKQTVTEWDYNGGSLTAIGSYTRVPTSVVLTGDSTGNNIVSVLQPATAATPNGSYGFEKIPAIDQPTFGILNPLAVRGGGVPLLPANSVSAVSVGDDLGPFRSVESTNPLPTATNASGDTYGLQALTNGNDVLNYAPSSTAGVGGNPTRRRTPQNDPAGTTAPTTTFVVVTTTGEIPHNTTGGNQELTPTAQPTGTYSSNGSTDGLTVTGFGGYGLDVFDRGALVNLGQTLRLKMTVPTNTLFAPPSGRDGLYWNSNFTNTAGNNPDNTGHDSVVNFLPWETPPVPYQIGSQANGSQDYPDIAPGNITQIARAISGGSGGDLTSNTVTLPQGQLQVGGKAGDDASVKARTVVGDPVLIQVAVPNHQPANQQLYQQPVQTPQAYQPLGPISPVNEAGASQINQPQVFPMGYVTSKRLYVPNANGFYSAQRPYRDVRIYTGVPVDMRTSIANPSVDIGVAPAALGVQTENDPNLGYFSPYNTLFQQFFKPLEIHNDGNVNLLNVHLNQKISVSGMSPTLPLFSDANDPLSFLNSFDLNTMTGPQNAQYQRLTSGGATLPLPGSNVPEQSFLVRSSVDTDLIAAYGRNPGIAGNVQFPGEQNSSGNYPNISTMYPGATFHKPSVGGNQPSILTVPDAPEQYVAGASLPSSPTPVIPANGAVYKSPPYVSLAFPFGTPVGTYHTDVPQPTVSDPQPASLRLFEGLDAPNAANGGNAYSLTPTNAASYLYPPQYGGVIGGIGAPTAAPTDVYTAAQPISTIGTQLIGTVEEQRLTDGATFGAVPMIDPGPAGKNAQGNANGLSYPDFAPAAFRDPSTGNLSVYWTSGRSGNNFQIFGANLPFTETPSGNTTGLGYFLPAVAPTGPNPTGEWWQEFMPAVQTNAINSGLSIAQGPSGTNYGFDVAVSTNAGPYSSTLYSYAVNASTGTLSALGAVTPTSSSSQVKYGIHGLSTNFANSPNLWAFWTASTRGRTAIYYNSQANGTWLPANPTVGVLPVPAGLTSVSDASPMLMPTAPVNGQYGSVIEATYSGTAPDGNIDLYVSRYLPDSKTPSQLDLVSFPPVTENLDYTPGGGGWYQSRDVAWSRTGALNVLVSYPNSNGLQPLLYSPTNVPLFTKAIYDKASGLLVLTGVQVPIIPASGAATQFTANTVYVDAATGRVRFSPALLPTQNFTQIRATFSPQARRLTTDSRADTAPVTFMDTALKPNDAVFVANSLQTANVEADRRWTIWRKSGVAGPQGSASLYFKTQRLTFFVPTAIDPTKAVTLNGSSYSGAVDLDYQRGRLYFPIASDLEGATISVTYTPLGGTASQTTPLDTVQWQDEPLANNNDVPPGDSAAGLDTIVENRVDIATATNENNAAAFLDPYASATSPHKVWLFWNSTRNGTADIYSETIDPRFAPGLTTP